MICQECEKETAEGQFCQYCGAKLATDEVAATESMALNQEVETSEDHQHDPQTQPEKETVQEPNKFAEKLKKESGKFSQFLLKLIKNPREAKSITGEHYISGIATIVILALTITLNHYFVTESFSESITSALGGSHDPSFLDDILLPFVKYLILFGVLTVIIFVASKIVLQEMTIRDAFAKYGAYLVPFTLLYIAGIIFSLINLVILGLFITVFSLIGIVMLIPILILTEQEVKGLDLVYTIIGVSMISIVAFGYLATNILTQLPF